MSFRFLVRTAFLWSVAMLALAGSPIFSNMERLGFGLVTVMLVGVALHIDRNWRRDQRWQNRKG